MMAATGLEIKDDAILLHGKPIGQVVDGQPQFVEGYGGYHRRVMVLLDDYSEPKPAKKAAPVPVPAPAVEPVADEAPKIPPAPERDHRGDKTPEYVAWMMKYHRAEAVVKYRKWLEKQERGDLDKTVC